MNAIMVSNRNRNRIFLPITSSNLTFCHLIIFNIYMCMCVYV